MQTKKIPTGSRIMDRMLHGGYDCDIITTIYGPAGSGKTNLAILCAINITRNNKKVIYIDTEGSFSLDRLRQIALDYKKVLGRMIFLRPASFKEQKKDFENLKDLVNDKIGLIIVDTIGMLYRIELGTSKDIYEVNRELGKQISYLSEIARKKQIPVLLTNQVYSDFGDKDKINIVGGDLLKYGSKCLIELQITQQNNRRAILRKHRSIAEEKKILFKIVETGVLGTKEGKAFGLF